MGLWLVWTGGDFGRGPLPYSGGFADQPSWLMEAFKIMEGVAATFRKKDNPESDDADSV